MPAHRISSFIVRCTNHVITKEPRELQSSGSALSGFTLSTLVMIQLDVSYVDVDNDNDNGPPFKETHRN